MDNEIFYKFRFTFEGQDENHDYEKDDKDFQFTTNWFIDQFQEYYLGKMTSGIEFLNSKGQPTWAHLHIHFSSKTKKDTIWKQIKRKWADDGFGNIVGNKQYSFKVETYVNEEKFFRYPLKQGLQKSWKAPNGRTTARQFGFTDQELELMYEKAHDCYLISQEVSNAKQDRKDEADSLYDRLLEAYKKNPKNDEVEILAMIFQFYQDEKRSININTCKGYVNNIMLDAKLITPLDLAKKVMRLN